MADDKRKIAKIINIDGRDVKFDVSVPIFYIYKKEFGEDLFKKLMAFASYSDKAKDAKDMASFMVNFEITDIANMIWAAAKNANKNIPDVVEWYKSFDDFPLMEVMEEVLSMMLYSLESKKK